MDRWQVVGQRQVTVPNDVGGFIQAVRVTFRTVDGDVGQVDIPQATFTAATARQQIDAYVDEMQALRGQP